MENGKDVVNGKDHELFLLNGDDSQSDMDSPLTLKKSKSGSKEHLIKKKDDYKSSFTVHGLTRICTGSRPEAGFWLFMLLLGIGCTTYVVHRLVTKYLKYEIYTEVHQNLTTTNFFPSITFCDSQLHQRHYFSLCRKSPQSIMTQKSNIFCSTQPKQYKKINDTMEDEMNWTNGKVHVTQCTSWGSTSCGTDDHIKSLHRQGHACFTWNHKGDFHDAYSHALIHFKIKKKTIDEEPPKIVAYIHDPSIEEIEVTNRVILEPGRSYELSIRKSHLIRLPHPFPSKCVENVPNQIFPGKYTRRTCLESKNYVNMYKKCGNVWDYHKSIIPKDILEKYQQNRTLQDVMKCMNEFSVTKVVASNEDCPFPCHEMDYHTTATCHGLDSKNDPKDEFIYRVDIQLQNVDSYRVIEEKQLYTWDQVLGEVGGLVGLVIGASVISLIEILAYLYLWLIDKCCAARKNYELSK